MRMDSRRDWLTGAAIVVAAFFFTRGYTGIRHDGILYAGDALARVVPGQFHDDLYFLFGSQGKFTALPILYGWLLTAFGLGAGTMIGLAFTSLAFLAASWFLVKAIAPGNLRFYCLLSLVLGWTIYGGRRIFAYSEPFLTARSFAEPLVLLGLALLLRQRRAWAVLAFGVALLFHPLIAAGGIAIAWVIVVLDDRRWLWSAALGLVALAMLGGLHAGPFSDLYQRYDDQWWALVQEVNVHAFVLNWAWLDFGIVAFDATVLGLAFFLQADARLRRVIGAALLVGIGSVLFSMLVVDLGRSVFFGKLQVWRALWIMHWLAVVMLPIVLARLWTTGNAGRVAACALGLGWMAPFSAAPALVAALAVAVYALRRRVEISTLLVRLMIVGVVLCGLMIAGQAELRAFKIGSLLDQSIRSVVAQSLSMNLVVLAVMVSIWHFRRRLGRAGAIVSVLLLCTSLFFWDQRAGWTLTMESYAIGERIWPGLIEENAKVYWYRDLMAPWILLGHGNYYTAQQGSGAVFSRDMVVELDQRRKLTALLDFQEQICRLMNGLNEKQTSCEPSREAVKEVCDEAKLDYVVLQSTLDGAKPLADFSTGVVENGYEKKFFLYRCSALKP